MRITYDTVTSSRVLTPRRLFAEQAKGKGKELFLAGCIVSEFGTRRRRTFEAQDIIMRGLIEANDEYSKGDGRGRLAGTSNVYFAYKYNLLPM